MPNNYTGRYQLSVKQYVRCVWACTGDCRLSHGSKVVQTELDEYGSKQDLTMSYEKGWVLAPTARRLRYAAGEYQVRGLARRYSPRDPANDFGISFIELRLHKRPS